MPLEEGAQPGENGLELLFGHDGHDDFKTWLLAEHKVRLSYAVMSFTRDIADNRVVGGFHSIQQIGDKRRCSPAMITRISFIECKIKPISNSPFSACFYPLERTPFLRYRGRRSLGTIAIPNLVFRVERDEMNPFV